MKSKLGLALVLLAAAAAFAIRQPITVEAASSIDGNKLISEIVISDKLISADVISYTIDTSRIDGIANNLITGQVTAKAISLITDTRIIAPLIDGKVAIGINKCITTADVIGSDAIQNTVARIDYI
jgi:hypothetical protein